MKIHKNGAELFQWTDGWTDTDRQLNGRMDGRTDRQTERQSGRQVGKHGEANCRFSQICEYAKKN